MLFPLPLPSLETIISKILLLLNEFDPLTLKFLKIWIFLLKLWLRFRFNLKIPLLD